MHILHASDISGLLAEISLHLMLTVDVYFLLPSCLRSQRVLDIEIREK